MPSGRRVLLTFNERNSLVKPLTQLVHAMGFSVHHLELSSCHPLNQTPAYREYATKECQHLVEMLSIDAVIPLSDSPLSSPNTTPLRNQEGKVGPRWILQGVFRDGVLQDYQVLEELTLWGEPDASYQISIERDDALKLFQRVGSDAQQDGLMEFECVESEGELSILEFKRPFSPYILHSLHSGSSLVENAIRVSCGEPTIPRKARSGLVNGQGIPLTRLVFNLHWIPRYWKLALAALHTYRKRPNQRVSEQPESATQLRSLPDGQEKRRKRAILTINDDNPVGAELTRVLHSMDYAVHHFNITGHQPTLTDPDYRRQVISHLKHNLERLEIDLFIGCFEEVFFLSGEELNVSTLLTPHEVYKTLHDKREAALFNKKHELPSVSTLIPCPGVTVREIEHLGEAPYFVKERDSRGGHGTRTCRTSREAHALIAENPENFVVQPLVEGDIWVLQGLYRDGQLIDYEVLRKFRLWNDRGSVRRMPFHRVEMSPLAVELMEDVGRLTGYQGMLEFECLGTAESLKILEYNPRFSGAFQHSVYAGSSLCRNAVNAYAGQTTVPHRSVQGSISRNVWSILEFLRRQTGVSIWPLLDPRWLLRWLRLELTSSRTRKCSPYSQFSPNPEYATRMLKRSEP